MKSSGVPDYAKMYEFLSDETLKRAVTRSLEIIGEATKISLPTEISLEYYLLATDCQYARQAHPRLLYRDKCFCCLHFIPSLLKLTI